MNEAHKVRELLTRLPELHGLQKLPVMNELLDLADDADQDEIGKSFINSGLKPIFDVCKLGDFKEENSESEHILLRRKALKVISLLIEEDLLQSSLVEQGVLPIILRIIYHSPPTTERRSAVRSLWFITENAILRDEVIKLIDGRKEWDDAKINILSNPVSVEEKDWFLAILKFLGFIPFTPASGTVFYDNLEDFPFVKDLEAKYSVIKQEFQFLFDKLVAWPEKYLCQKGWDVFGLYAFQNKLDHNCKLCPETSKALENVPGMVTAMFSCLQPKTHIKPHTGYYQYSEKILRCHLAIKVPSGCVLKVNGIERTWQEGKCMIFDDTFYHEAWNKSNELRVVLMIDFMYSRSDKCMKPNQSLGSKDDIALISKDLLETLNSYGKTENFKEKPIGYTPSITN
eukprot:TRINITY_DN7526_c0_g1_i4.p1 TRINITY_DN7526_c0_g1~~TRINITY_DN7526_c0_g1_i4.p1  ORF type:complete len:400 (-),score=51.78 TRINITY_DN7526_c0_g1_i4:28-1227(-)